MIEFTAAFRICIATEKKPTAHKRPNSNNNKRNKIFDCIYLCLK